MFTRGIDAETAAEASSVPRSVSEWVAEAIAFGAVLTNAITTLTFWPRLPDQVPTHFTFSGEIDGWGSKNSLLWLVVAAVFIYGVLTVVARFPRWFNYPVRVTVENLHVQYRLARWLLSWIKAVSCWLLTGVGLISLAVALGIQEPLGVSAQAYLVVLVMGGLVADLGLVVSYLMRALSAQRTKKSCCVGDNGRLGRYTWNPSTERRTLKPYC